MKLSNKAKFRVIQAIVFFGVTLVLCKIGLVFFEVGPEAGLKYMALIGLLAGMAVAYAVWEAVKKDESWP
jgi:hypothetical protein